MPPSALRAWLAFMLVVLDASTPLFASDNPQQVELGRMIFNDSALSRDHKTSCASCHDPKRAYSDFRPKSMGASGNIGTRNAPSLVGVSERRSFFWDGRREHLEDVVLDPFTNPVELGLTSLDTVLAELQRDAPMMRKFHAAFPTEKVVPTRQQLQRSLAAFLRSLDTGTSFYDQSITQGKALSPAAEMGRQLFVGIAHCSECHAIDGHPAPFTDGRYHHSGIGQPTATLIQTVVQHPLSVDELGPKLLTDVYWSAASL